MVKLQGIHLTASTDEELHHFARKVVLSKSWFHPTPFPHYDVLCPHKANRIVQLIERAEKKKDKLDNEIEKIFKDYLVDSK